MDENCDIAIVGAGAAGLAAAIFAAPPEVTPEVPSSRSKARIILLDGAAHVGAKILVSGGGRCNVTHDHIEVGDFNGPVNIVRNVLKAFDEKDAIDWFASLGVELKREETGKLFPISDSARTVLNALLKRVTELGVELRANCRVHSITPAPGSTPPTAPDGTFTIRYGDVNAPQELTARRVILATGGKSLSKTGSDGQGWEMARTLGHTVTDTYAALVPLVLDGAFFHAGLSGIALEVELTTEAAGKVIDKRAGSLLWTHFGVSGPVVMDASRFWVMAKDSGREPVMRCALLPGMGFEEVEKWLVGASQGKPNRPIVNVVATRLPVRVAEAVVEHSGIAWDAASGQVTRELRRKLVHALTGLELPVVSHRGWNYAEVTAGGVPLREVDFRTMESRKVRGLYLVGEMLDCEGRIGGFNFQWAWATGHIAGKAAAKSITGR